MGDDEGELVGNATMKQVMAILAIFRAPLGLLRHWPKARPSCQPGAGLPEVLEICS